MILFPSLTASLSILKNHFKSSALFSVFMTHFETKTISVLGPDMEPYHISKLIKPAVQMASQTAHLCPQVTPQPQKGVKRKKNQAKGNEQLPPHLKDRTVQYRRALNEQEWQVDRWKRYFIWHRCKCVDLLGIVQTHYICFLKLLISHLQYYGISSPIKGNYYINHLEKPAGWRLFRFNV